MKLHSYFRSSAAFRVRIALALKGLDYEYAAVHLLQGGGEQFADTFKAINPAALVPVLEDFAAPANGIYAVFAHAKHMPLRLRLWIDFLKHHYAQPGFWRAS